MSRKFKNRANLIITVLTLFVFVLPMFCSVAHAENSGTIYSAQVDYNKATHLKAETDKHENKSEKANCDCCVAHHCCAAKLVMSKGMTVVMLQSTSAIMIAQRDHIVLGFSPASLDRPPKNFA